MKNLKKEFKKTGIILLTKSEIISEQKGWDEDDESKNFDFTIYNFWICPCGSSASPVGFDTLKEIKIWLKNEKIINKNKGETK